jgi:hypothetical protein
MPQAKALVCRLSSTVIKMAFGRWLILAPHDVPGASAGQMWPIRCLKHGIHGDRHGPAFVLMFKTRPNVNAATQSMPHLAFWHSWVHEWPVCNGMADFPSHFPSVSCELFTGHSQCGVFGRRQFLHHAHAHTHANIGPKCTNGRWFW